MKKTKHCKQRQWERGISDYLLEKVCWAIPKLKKGKNCYLVGSETQKRLGLPKKNLLVVMEDNVVITVFYIDNLASYLLGRKQGVSLQSVSII